ncbi:PREDICTED: uncharacterized protein LOC107343376 [Acropora digitifera]|uniref:uncharacterized protein LOC107343376 n=1 Tax=Acropora digitifera TaxID=70779 RepID=UPI00077A4D31|nr:PREDICTED: uncharacterized protein LOC107343376 [Acropora digitifera]
MEAKTLKSPEAETKTCVAGRRIESGDETRLKTTEDVEASLVNQTIAVETKKSDHVTPASCTSVQSGVSANLRVCDREETEVAESTTVESTQENQEFNQEKRRTSPRLLAAEKELTKEASENKSKQPSLNSLSCDVQVKLSDCRGICVSSNKPVLESSSAVSETESIRLSTEENLPTSKEAASRDATSETQDEEISSTPTINCCPSSPNSENSGYSNETGGGYRLRKRSNQQDKIENENISKRTRSNCSIPDEEQRVDPSQANVLSPSTSVKTKGLTEKSELFKGRGNQTPERKTRKIKGKLKSPSHTAPREKIMNKKGPESESDDSTFSESPRSGPMRETRSMRASVRSLDTKKCAMEATVQPSASSEQTVSVDHLSKLAIPIRDQVPARNNGEGSFPQSSFSLEGQAAHGVACLFDSDDENEEFYGFNVPQFDKSFSSEGELSYQINTLVESINRGNTDRNHSDVKNSTMTGIFERTNERVTIKKTADEELTNTGSKEITRGENVDEEIWQTEHEDPEQRTRKRKSATDCVGSGTAKRAKSEEAASRNATSEAQDEEISSTPTINCCPSSPNSENSGYSNETDGGYRLRKRSNQQDEKENENISKRTRSNCHIPDEEQKVDPSQANVSFSFTSVKTKGLTEKSELFKGRGNQTPDRKTRKIKGKLKSPSHTAPSEKIVNKKDPESESDDSTFSESPRSGPMRETRSMRASVRSLDTNKCAMEATVQPSASSEKTVSVDHLSKLAIPIRDRVPARNNGEGSFPQSSFSLEGQAAHGVSCLFDSDDENEEFYGFNVPQFDKSFSSEGELSYQINTLVESINRGNTDRNHSDVNNSTMTKIFEQTNERVTIKKTGDEELTNTGSKEITQGEKVNEEISQTEHAEQEQRTRKRKSATDCVGSVTAKRAKSEGAYEEARFKAANMALSPVIDSGASHDDADDDVDDDVFSAVSDSTDGEEEDAESPFSFTSWRQKRKSEDIQPELERPTKRRKSNLRWCDTESGPGPSSLTSTFESYLNCEIERVIEEKSKDATESSGKTTICDEIAKEESTGIAGHRPSMECASVLLVESNETAVDALRYDALLEKTYRGRCVSTTVDFNDSYYDDEPIIQTMEERVKLRRKRDDSLKASQNSSSVENQDNEIDKSSTTSASSRGTSSSTKSAILPLKPLKRVTATTRKDNLPLKPLKRISTSQATSQKVFLPLKPLQRTSSTQSSVKPNRTRSSPSFTRPLPATTFGNTRRPTWIFDQGSFGSSLPEVPRFGAKSFRHSTPTSSKAKYTLRSRKRASWNLKQQDAFAFDE